MIRLFQRVAIGSLTVATLAAIAVAVLHGNSTPQMAHVPVSAPCHSAPPSLIGGGEWNGQSGTLTSQAVLRARICRASVLRLKVRGSLAENEGPLLLVSLDDKIILQREVRIPQSLKLELVRPGTVVLAFANDRYITASSTTNLQDRNLFVDEYRLTPVLRP